MRITCFGFITLLLAFSAFAQGELGTITGNVTDAAGALMPGVRVELKNTDTGSLYQISSTATGNYTAGQLPAGTYQISAAVRGFKPYSRSGITIVTGQTIRVDIALTMLASDEVLTNESVIKLVKAGIDEDVIIAKVRESQCNFDLSVDGMVSLKGSGVSDRLMGVLMNPAKPLESKPAPPASAASKNAVKPAAPKDLVKVAEEPAPSASLKLPSDIGVYMKKGEQWADIQPEIVTYHTSGAFARLATAGIVQNDLNGRVNGPHSGNVVKVPMEFLIVPAEGVAITEYQLIHLQQQRSYREFLSVVGGIFSSSGGATRDLLKFDSTKILNRAYSVKLDALSAGEYGFLLASTDASSTKSGKIYTFRIAD